MRSIASIAICAISIFAVLDDALGQRLRGEISQECLVQFGVHPDYEPVPTQLGKDFIYLRNKFETKTDRLNYRSGDTVGYLYVLEFRTDSNGQPLVPITESGEPGPPIALEDLPPEIRRQLEELQPVGTWEEFIRKTVRDFDQEGVQKRGKKTQPDHTIWEWRDPRYEYRWMAMAACYQLDEHRQIVVLAGTYKEKDYARNGRRLLTKMVTSLRTIDDDEAEELGINANRDKHADTDWKQAALLAAKKNIQSLRNWDYFTTPNYIVLYSWDLAKAGDSRPSLRFAKGLAKLAEKCREHYMEHFPPHEDMLQMYSVLRICYTRVDFQKYGDTPLGVAGWFNPGTKELVVFHDREEIYGDEQSTISTLFHEGWHQYGHGYFGEDVELHRWFGEGTGDFFGAFRSSGSRWKHTFDEGRIRSLQQMIPRESFVPLEEIVTWNKDKFYGPAATNHYAQGYAMVEFLKHGKKVMRSAFQDEWGEIYGKYVAAMLEHKDQTKAVEIAFEGINWDEFQDAWVEFVKKAMLR